jgi:FtsP/CotA-like multicopper oxidase with cupredoxin domain
MPGQVLRLVIRWTPSSVKVIRNKSYAGRNFYSFDPTKGPGYVWHCHIIDHEDNEMMRPYKVAK